LALTGVRRTCDQNSDSAGQQGKGLAGLNTLGDNHLKHLRVRRSGRTSRSAPSHRPLRRPVQIPRRRRGDDPDRHARSGVRRAGDHELLPGDSDGELLPPPHSLGDGHHVRRPAVGALRVGDAGYVGAVGRSASGTATGTARPPSVPALPVGPVGRIVDGHCDLQRLARPGVGRAPDLHYAVSGVDLKFFPGHDVIGHRDAKDSRVAPDAVSSGTIGAGIATVRIHRGKPPASAGLALSPAGSVRSLPLLFVEEGHLAILSCLLDRNER
jgi:hypothetical protein